MEKTPLQGEVPAKRAEGCIAALPYLYPQFMAVCEKIFHEITRHSGRLPIRDAP